MESRTRRFYLYSAAAALVCRAQRRHGVTVARTKVVIHPAHPIRRSVNRTVVVRTPRTAVRSSAPLVFLPAVAFAATVAVLPARERLYWQDTDTIHQDEQLVESNFGVDKKGGALLLEIDGRAGLDFADITFANGDVQTVDFNDRTFGSGIYSLLNFPGQRTVKTVRLLAQSKSGHTKFRLYLSA